jgi:hypothetical protein
MSGRSVRSLALAVAAAVPLVLAVSQAAGAQAAGARVSPATGSWTQTSPVVPAGGTFSGSGPVSCAARNYCVALGLADFSGTYKPYADLWNGTAWTLLPSPQPPSGGSQLQLNSVFCLHPTFCLAAGEYYGFYTQPVTERWNGTTWAPLTTPAPSGAVDSQLNSVSCSSATDCMVVGAVNEGDEGTVGPFSDTWNGTTWTVNTAPMQAFAYGVACPVGTFCEAVGTGSASTPYAQSWNGTTWTAQSLSLPAGATLPTLYSVWCGSATDCVAVGTYKQGPWHPLTEAWNGTTWTKMPTQPIADLKSATLTSVSCGTEYDCVAVGSLTLSTAPKASQIFSLHWNTERWVTASPAAPADLYSSLDSVSCAHAYDCTAVGVYNTTTKTSFPLGEQDS